VGWAQVCVITGHVSVSLLEWGCVQAESIWDFPNQVGSDSTGWLELKASIDGSLPAIFQR
jgi:hypothetical protein